MNLLNNSKVIDSIIQNGKYGVIALGLCLSYLIIDKAIEKDYFVTVDLKNQKLELSKNNI